MPDENLEACGAPRAFRNEEGAVTRGVIFDFSRTRRLGMPEAVFCQGKPWEALSGLMTRFAEPDAPPVLFTRLDADVFARLPCVVRSVYDYHALSRTAWCHALPACVTGSVAVVSAGTADGAVTWEAARTLAFHGVSCDVYEDCGVAGLWRLGQHIETIARHDAVIAVAGLDAALVSVLGGLVACPLIAVPTSVGYGVAAGGRAALQSVLASCAPGVCAMNIDNGYGAACAALRIVRLLGAEGRADSGSGC